MIRLTVIIIGLLIAVASCNKNNQQDNAPIVPVNTTINISLPQYQSLNSPGGWAYAIGGIKGLIIYRRDVNEFVAFDRNCTYNEENSCGTAEVDSNNVLINCACDGSIYNIYDGTINQGPATLPLRQYSTTFDGNTNVRIYN